MTELVYASDEKDCAEIQEAIKKEFPTAKMGDASDSVHPHRFSVDADIDEDDFYRWAMKFGVFFCLLGGNLMVYSDPDHVRALMNDVGIPTQKEEVA